MLDKGRQFNDEELSRIFSAHAGGQLRRNGQNWGMSCEQPWRQRGCILQVAALYPETILGEALRGTYRHAGRPGFDDDIGSRFDVSYQAEWSVEEFLAWLESEGAA